MRVRFTAQADADIIDSYLYGFEKFGRDQAERYEEGLRHVVDIIETIPALRPSARSTARRCAFIITPSTTSFI